MNRLPVNSRNLWSLTVLCLLRQRPMHPYEIQRLIRERKKDDFLDLKRGSLYHAIGRLVKAGLIETVETTREGRRPERTVYCLTADGERELLAWLGDLLARPAADRSPFFAAVSFLAHLTPEEVINCLQERTKALRTELTALDASLEALTPRIGRIVMLETEYSRAMRRAELDWVAAAINDIRAGRLTWDPAVLLKQP